jgi:glycosyltransferase involved in cell wall biosynthesis
MINNPLLSICVPAYRRAEYLKRLLDSIAMQTFRDFEVVITDDSPDNSVRAVIGDYADAFPLVYYHNDIPLGTPENWNEAVRRSRGPWIKIMHDDDWFADADSLRCFAEMIRSHPDAGFFYSGFCNVYPDGRQESVIPSRRGLSILQRNPADLFASNLVGPPSCMLYARMDEIAFDKRMKWLVDIDFYMRRLAMTKVVCSRDVLVNIGIGEGQMTRRCFRNPEVEIPESFLLLEKLWTKPFASWRFFDGWWLLIRNLGIRDEGDIRTAGYEGLIPDTVRRMIRWQRSIPARILKVGVFSKIIMGICFVSK